MLVNQDAELATLNLPEAMELATQTHRNGYLVEAEALYGFILQSKPRHPPALQCLGLLLHQRGYSDQAVLLLQASIELAPTAERHSALGNMLIQQGRMQEALTEFEDALNLEPENAEYWNSLGETLQRQYRSEDAANAFQQAIALQPRYVDALCNLGNLLAYKGQASEAAEYYCRAIVANPQRSKSKALLGIAYAALGRIEEAADVYRQWLVVEPDNAIAAHMHAACSGEMIPVRATNRYIETTFDAFAPTFDEQLLGQLSYQVPKLIEAALAKTLAPAQQRRGLDAGCGTGLCGSVIKPFVTHLTGVDLSSKMLALASQRALYDSLKKAELTKYLFNQVEAFDLIVMADTLIYFGALENVMESAYQALRPGGVFIFSVEGGTHNSSVNLNLYGRYSHGREYVSATLASRGFAIAAVDSNTLRTELGCPVEGLVITVFKPA